MADRTIMNAKDAVSASLAECFVTIGDHRLEGYGFRHLPL